MIHQIRSAFISIQNVTFVKGRVSIFFLLIWALTCIEKGSLQKISSKNCGQRENSLRNEQKNKKLLLSFLSCFLLPEHAFISLHPKISKRQHSKVQEPNKKTERQRSFFEEEDITLASQKNVNNNSSKKIKRNFSFQYRFREAFCDETREVKLKTKCEKSARIHINIDQFIKCLLR